MSQVCVGDVAAAIEAAFPAVRAEEWDRCGLLAGDSATVVTRVACALDPDMRSVRAAVAGGANVLVTHHPAFLAPPTRIVAGAGSGGVVHEAVRSGVALINAHTNLDRDPAAQRLLPLALGLEPVAPIERGTQPLAMVTVYAPEGARERVVAAMGAAGAGRIGDYEACSFTAFGTGSFTPGAHASPAVGTPGTLTDAPEVRIEMVCPREAARAVAGAAASAHPYEEPLIAVSDVEIARNAAALGMVSRAPEGLTLGDLARTAARTFGVTPRVWRDSTCEVSLVATATGSAGSLIGDAIAAEADVLLAGEVRYHDAHDAAAAGLAIIEVGHDVSEWPLVPLLERAVRSLPGLQEGAVFSLPAEPGWWTP